MKSTKSTNSPEVAKIFIQSASIVCVAIAILFLIVFCVVFPSVTGSFAVYVPAKAGGDTHLLSQATFLTVNAVALGIATALTGAALVLFRKGRFEGAFACALFVVFFGSLYTATILGNAFDALWGGLWWILGVVSGLGVGWIASLLKRAPRSKV